ncbi:MAG: hypothetical protein ABIL09_05290 [Gemmatimonadota bacterium]
MNCDVLTVALGYAAKFTVGIVVALLILYAWAVVWMWVVDKGGVPEPFAGIIFVGVPAMVMILAVSVVLACVEHRDAIKASQAEHAEVEHTRVEW